MANKSEDLRFTLEEFKYELTLAIGDAIARLLKVAAKSTPGKLVAIKPIRLEEYLGTNDEFTPTELDYIGEGDLLYPSMSGNKIRLLFVARDGYTFSVEDEKFYFLTKRFVDYFIRAYKA